MGSILIDFGVLIVTALFAFLASTIKSNNHLQAVREDDDTDIKKYKSNMKSKWRK